MSENLISDGLNFLWSSCSQAGCWILHREKKSQNFIGYYPRKVYWKILHCKLWWISRNALTHVTIDNLNFWQSLSPHNQEWHWTAFAILAMFIYYVKLWSLNLVLNLTHMYHKFLYLPIWTLILYIYWLLYQSCLVFYQTSKDWKLFKDAVDLLVKNYINIVLLPHFSFKGHYVEPVHRLGLCGQVVLIVWLFCNLSRQFSVWQTFAKFWLVVLISYV